MITMDKKQQKYYRDKKAGLLSLQTRLATMGVNVRVLIDDDTKQQETKEVA